MGVKTAWEQNETPLYHFTSLKSFTEINRTGLLRLWPCNNAKNAAVETMALYSTISKILDEDHILKEKLLKEYDCNDNKSLLSSIIKDREKTYMACFSVADNKKSENMFLKNSYMWKFYADNYNGVLIKFNYKCFPYTCSSSQAIYTPNGKMRSSEIRTDRMIYCENKLKKRLNETKDFHLFACDTYKPKFCDIENESRILFFLRESNDISHFPNISVSINEGEERPEYLEYNFSKSPGCIENVFCFKSKTYQELCRIFDKNRVVKLNI